MPGSPNFLPCPPSSSLPEGRYQLGMEASSAGHCLEAGSSTSLLIGHVSPKIRGQSWQVSQSLSPQWTSPAIPGALRSPNDSDTLKCHNLGLLSSPLLGVLRDKGEVHHHRNEDKDLRRGCWTPWRAWIQLYLYVATGPGVLSGSLEF